MSDYESTATVEQVARRINDARSLLLTTHVKPDGLGSQDPRDLIEKQLAGLNDLGVRVVMARQGLRIEF